jgi:hypothetical protein
VILKIGYKITVTVIAHIIAQLQPFLITVTVLVPIVPTVGKIK